MAIVKSINVSISAVTTGFESGLNKARKALNGFVSGTLGTIGQLAGVSVSLYGTAAAIRSMIGTSEEFAKSMAQSTAIMGDMSAEMRAEMELTAKQVSFQTVFSASEAAKAYFFLASAGLDAQQSIAAMPTVAKFAQAGMFDLSTATDLLMDAQTAMGLRTADATENMRQMSRVANVLVKGNIISTATVEQLASALTNDAAGALRITNKSVEEGVAILAAFASQGVKAEEAGTQLAIVLRDLQNAALKNASAFKQSNIAVFEGGEVRNVADILQDLEAALASLAPEQKKLKLMELGFQDRSVKAIQGLLGTSTQIRQFQAQLESAGGVVDSVASKNIPELTKNMNQLRATWDAFSIDIGGQIAAGLASQTDGVSVFAQSLATIADVVWTIGLAWKAMKPFIIALQHPIDTLKGGVAELGIMVSQFVIDTIGMAMDSGALSPAAMDELGNATVSAAVMQSRFMEMKESVKETSDAVQRAAQEFNESLLQDTPGQKFLETFKAMQQQLDATAESQGQSAGEMFMQGVNGVLGREVTGTFSELWKSGTAMASDMLSQATAAAATAATQTQIFWGDVAGAMNVIGQDLAKSFELPEPVKGPAAIEGGINSAEVWTAFREAGRNTDDKKQTELQMKMEQHLSRIAINGVVLGVAGL